LFGTEDTHKKKELKKERERERKRKKGNSLIGWLVDFG